jgi:AcrR family transcriptional regulator
MPGYVRAAERREQLLAAARAVLVRDGLNDLTLRAVAAEAGVRLSALQYIFPTRADLVDGLVDAVLADVGASELEVGDLGLERELRRMIDWFADVGLGDPAVAELLRFELVASVSPASEPVPYPLGGPILAGRIGELVGRIAENGQELWARPVEQIAALWTDALLGLIVRGLQAGDPELLRERGMELVEQVVALAQPRPRG